MSYTETEILTREQAIAKAHDEPYAMLQGSDCEKLSLYEFLYMFWDEVAATGFKDNWHVRYLCEALEEMAVLVATDQPREHDLIINIPPGTTKTIICSIMFPAWCWSRGWYWMQFITASYSAMLSLESAEKSRDLIKSDKFVRMFPDLIIKDDKDTKSNFRIAKRIGNRVKNGGNRFSTSVGGTLTGFHGHILIIDDPLNPEQAASEKELENSNRWMEQTLPTRKVDKESSATVIVMQRLHQDDPTGRAVIRKKTKLKHICLPGEIRNYKEHLNPPEVEKYYVDDLLDPTRLSWSVLAELEQDLGQYGYAGQIGQNPTPPGGGMFKVANISVLDRLPPDTQIVSTVRYWDKAATEGAGAFTAGLKMSLTRTGLFIIHDVTKGQWGATTREKIMKTRAITDGGTVKIGIEQEPGSGGKESAQASVRNLAGYSVVLDRPTGDKAFRADPFSVQVNNGNVAILRGSWNHDFVAELEMFPNGTYKDQVDAGSGAFHMLVLKKKVRVIR